MDRKTAILKLKRFWEVGRFWVGIVIILTFALVFGPKIHHAAREISHEFHGLQGVQASWQSLQSRIAHIGHAVEENAQLRAENASLRTRLEKSLFQCREKMARSQTEEISLRLRQETGTPLGRTLASIRYEVPPHLLAPQLFALGTGFFEKSEFEKAAVVFSHLTGPHAPEAYRTAKNDLLAAVSWYRIDNLELSQMYLDRILKLQETPENLKYQAQARLWKALISKRSDLPKETQRWLRDFIDHHPHSIEAQWVNSVQEGGSR